MKIYDVKYKKIFYLLKIRYLIVKKEMASYFDTSACNNLIIL